MQGSTSRTAPRQVEAIIPCHGRWLGQAREPRPPSRPHYDRRFYSLHLLQCHLNHSNPVNFVHRECIKDRVHGAYLNSGLELGLRLKEDEPSEPSPSTLATMKTIGVSQPYLDAILDHIRQN